MAKKVSENNILSITEDWGLDTSNNLPYSGAAVQKFIKDTFDTKVGYFHYDVTTNRYLVFANEAKKDEYLENPTLTELVLGSFDAPFNYEATIDLFTPQYNAVFFGSTGNYLDFTFDIKNKAGASTGESVTVTYTFIRNATKKVITETRRYGESVHFNIDDYLLEGTNTIIIGVSGQTTLAATTSALTYNVINLQYSDEMNISKVYDLSNGSKTMEVFFTASGYGTKIVEWFLDGDKLDFVKTEDEVVDVMSHRTKYITLSNLSDGIHTLQSRLYTVINGEKFYTDTLYREFIVSNGGTENNCVVVAANLPNSHGIVDASNPFFFYGAEQYIPYEIRFAVKKTSNVSISLNNELLSIVNATSGTELYYTINSNSAGTLSIKFAIDSYEREIPFNVNNTSLNLEEIKTSLSFDFRAVGKSNQSLDKDVWAYEGYTATFSGFNWNASSGWVDNALVINSGASFSVDISPLSKDATTTGKTLEFEFSTRNVENDNAVICDLTTNGKGLLITASEAKLTSAAGETVSTKFKSGEINRIAFVINRKSGVTYKGLIFVYVNGILSGAVNYGSADNFISNKQLSFIGTNDAQIELRSMRFYDIALSSDNILNNYILYRDTLDEMMEMYYKNEIYEEGTQTFSPDAILHRLPVMIITGDIPTLEAATSTSTQILVDIDYTNEQDSTKNFKMKNAALRIQGTSSLAYPRKNFRFYTRTEESTVVYDANGEVVADKLYSFVDGAQPVDCWCLKADFAESSGTHNTGIARIWNDVMYGAVIQYTNILGEETNGYALRTQAQNAALSANYIKDVRTTIDGFPIVLFYKRNANDTDLIFLGKYNFNNDKSTPSVFGFEDIPNFDNSRMQCWETKDNGHPLGLFTNVSNFDSDWSEAFESRYPDTKSPNTADLKAFSQWMNSVSQSDFATQKWQHLDVYKVAAYYVYLMRFGAVDQTVKNGFLTSEDGQKFFFINYDNDTINGLINTGELRLDPTINRQTIGSDGEYVYAGHNSKLWNRCEADTEFMDIVSVVDNALYSAGLRYDEIMRVFNDEQCDKWVERIYNQDAEYKYLLPYVNSATNNLFMLQGSRSSHRAWWLSKRFALYDSLLVSGAYRDRNVSFKCLNDTQPGQQFTITAGSKMNFGYGINNGIRETGVELNVGGKHTFTTTDTLNLGDVVKIFGASDLSELDLSPIASRLAVLDCSAASDNVLGSKMKKLVLGGISGVRNTELSSISGINKLTSLQEVNIMGYEGITTLDLTTQKDFRKLYAKLSKLSSVDFAAGAPVEYLELPSSITQLTLQQLPYLNSSNIVLENGFKKVNIINVSNCPNISDDFSFIKNWLNTKEVENNLCSLVMDNVVWNDMSVYDLISLGQCKANGMNIELHGYANLPMLTLDQVNDLKAVWGDDCFNTNADFKIITPETIFIIPEDANIPEGNSVQFSYELISNSTGTIKYEIIRGSRVGTSIDEKTGLLTTIENQSSTTTITVQVTFTKDNGETLTDTTEVTINRSTYPTNSNTTLSGPTTVSGNSNYVWICSNPNVTSNMVADWKLTGTAVDSGYISLGETTLNTCKVNYHKSAEPNQTVTATLQLTLKKNSDGSEVLSKSVTLTMNNYVYPTASNTTMAGTTTPTDEPFEYTWESSITGNVGPIEVEWSLDEYLAPYFEVQSQEWSTENVYHGSCIIKKVNDVEFFAKGSVQLTITYTNSGQSFVLTGGIITILGADVLMTVDTNPGAMEAMVKGGLCANSQYMTKEEAAAVKDNQFNPTGSQTGSIFYNNKNITSFDELQYFTGLTQLDAYTFYTCDKLSSLKIPATITKFKTYCVARRNSSDSKLVIEEVNVDEINNYAFYSNTSNKLIINVVNWRSTQSTSSTRTMMYNVGVNKFNAFALPTGVYYSSPFNSCVFDVAEISDTVNSIPSYCFEGTSINDLRVPDSVTTIGEKAFSGSYKTLRITQFSKNIQTIDSNAFQYPIFDTDVEFNNLTSTLTDVIQSATYNGLLDISSISVDNYYKELRLNIFFSGNVYCDTLLLPISVPNWRNSSTPYSGSIKHIYLPDLQKYCQSSISGNSAFMNAENLYTIDRQTGKYVNISNLTLSQFDVTALPTLAFSYCNAIKKCDATSVGSFGEQCFSNSNIEELTINSQNGTGQISANAFANCNSLKTIIDTSTRPWATLTTDAFNNVNANVTINSQVFGLYKQSSGFTLSPMESGVVSALAFGDYTFTAPSGAAFGDGTTSKTITLGAGNKIQDLTDMLKIEYLTLVVSSNLDGAQLKLTYTSSDGTAKEDVVSAGSHLLKVTKGTTVKVEANETPKGWTAPAATNVTMSSTSNSVTMNFSEETLVYIADTSGNLYTEAEWTASGKSNDQAEGVCVMRAKSGGFIIAKTDASESRLAWGGYNKTISGIVTSITSSTAVLDMDGIGNTPKIIEQCAGYTSNNVTGAPAAEACANYTFPSGQTGYLPALGEWDLAYDHKVAIVSAMKLIGGTAIKSDYYWSSAQYSSYFSWNLHWSNGTLNDYTKTTDSYVRAFAVYGYLFISSTLSTRFTVSYTNNYNEQVTQRVGVGGHNLNVKVGTQVTVTPDAIGNITAEPQIFTWQGFTHECNFVFAKDAGVYIQHVNGSLYTESEWTAGGYANSDANGVAILSETVPAFVIAKQDASSSTLRWGGYDKTVPGIVTDTSYATAVLDYDGAGNTPKIIEYLAGTNDGYVDGAPAAEACAAFTFPNGKKGYLPALGEWKGAYDNKTAVVSAMTLIGGTAISTDNYYCSSTQDSSDNSWILHWDTGDLGNNRKSYDRHVRAFTAL